VFRNALLAGELMVTTGTAATVKVVVALPVLPAWSVAATMIVWLPGASPLYGCGLVQAVAAAASSLQVVPVTEVVASVAVKTVLTELPVVEPLAGEVIETTGAMLSTVKVTDDDPVPATFVAATTTVWLPWLRPG
jgi:hypothetical protein